MKNVQNHLVSAPRDGAHSLATAVLLVAVLIGLESCRKSEQVAEAPAAAPTAVKGPAPGPAIREAAEPNRPPYSGLKSPRGAALDDKGRLWVVDTGNAAIRIFDSAGGFLGGWGGRGTGAYALSDPFGIAIRGEDVYVADTFGTGIELFSIAGDWKAKLEAGLYAPHCVAAAPDGRVWVGDSGFNRVVVCDQNLTNPRGIGKKGSGPEDILTPFGVAVGPSGNVYVADMGNRRIQVLDSKGNFKAHWKFNGFGPDCEAYLDVDQDETVYASDSLAQVVVHLDRSGNELHRWTADDTGQKFSRPAGLAVDRKNRILYVVNSSTNSIAKLKLSGS